MVDQFHEAREIQQGFAAGKGDGLDPLTGCVVDDFPDRIGRQRGSGKMGRGPHAALGAGGVAAIGNLDDDLAGNAVVQDGLQGLIQKFLSGMFCIIRDWGGSNEEADGRLRSCLFYYYGHCLSGVSKRFVFDYGFFNQFLIGR
jgi:hypothetical protein